MKKLTLLIGCLISLVTAASAQYSTSYTYGGKDLTSYSTSGTSIWQLLGGGGVCNAGTLAMSQEGQLWCAGGDFYAYTFNPLTQTYTQQTAMGHAIYGLAVQDSHNIYVISSAANCSGSNGVYKWNGSSLVRTNATQCLNSITVGADGVLSGILGTTLYYSFDSGATWTLWSTGWTYIAAADATTMCGVNGAGQLYQLSTSSGAVLQSSPGSTVGCAITQQSSKHPLFVAWDTTGAVHIKNTNGTWSNISGLTAGTLAATTKANLMALDTLGHPYHWNAYAPYISGNTTGQWLNGCPGPGNICNPSATHSGHLQVKFSSGHGVNANAGLKSQTIPYNGAMNITSWDASSGCDPIFGTSGDSECMVMSSGGEQCNQSGANLGSPAAPTFPCISNVVPPYWFGWNHGITVDIYVSNHWNGTQQSDICNGIANWSAFNQNAYICHSATAPPAQSYQGNYIWVSYDPTYSIPVPMSGNHACGYWSEHGYGSSECPVGGVLKHPWIIIGPFPDTALTGVGAHEEGHDNWLFNCYNCQYGGSVMGSQGTWETSQPTAPTVCDIFWAGIWNLI